MDLETVSKLKNVFANAAKEKSLKQKDSTTDETTISTTPLSD